MRIHTDKSIGSGEEPKLREILEKNRDMTERDKKMLKEAIIKNLYIRKERKR